MLGAAGALSCVAAGTALGVWLRGRKQARFRMLQAQTEALGGMRLLLEQERPALPELLTDCAGYVSIGKGAEEVARRLMITAETLNLDPLCGLTHAYREACIQVPMPWEQAEERLAMEALFRQLGCGTASMREQAVAACIRRIRPLLEAAQTEAVTGGRLCMQLGLLVGLMAGIALW